MAAKAAASAAPASQRLRRIVVFGGNGYVGARALELLEQQQAPGGGALELVSVSRRGKAPAHLQGRSAVTWAAGDALEPSSYAKWLGPDTGVLVSVGSPPVPTLSAAAHAAQVRANGLSCRAVIEEASRAGVPRLVLVGAAIPEFAPSGYVEGKAMGLEAAREFAKRPNASAVVLQPTAINGTRHTESGLSLPLWLALTPASKLLELIEWAGVRGALEKAAPRVFSNLLTPFVTVDQVAQASVGGLLGPGAGGGLRIVTADQLRKIQPLAIAN
jgi:nucleoside-diphosphate-sugar epimerase